MAFAGKIANTHNNKTKGLTFTESLTFIKHKKRWKPKIVRTADYNCAYVSKIIIFPVFLQTVINLIMLSIDGLKNSSYGYTVYF